MPEPVHFIPYGSYISECGHIQDLRHPDSQTDRRRDVTCGYCQEYMTDLGDLPEPANHTNGSAT